MRGSPLLRALIAFVAILLLGWPLLHLTGKDSAPKAIPEARRAAETSEITLQLTFTSTPSKFALRHLGHDLWSGSAAGGSLERTVRMPYPEQGVDLQVIADFPEGAPIAAVRVVLTDPRGDVHERSCWGSGRIDEVLTFP